MGIKYAQPEVSGIDMMESNGRDVSLDSVYRYKAAWHKLGQMPQVRRFECPR